MSDLLDQAIIDADALKEAAIKNAETTIIEKYSDDIKSAVEQLLEQGPPPEMGAPPPEMMAGPAQAPTPGPPSGPENTAGMQYGHAVGAPEQEFRVDLGQLVAEMKMGELDAKEYEKRELVAEELAGTGEEPEVDRGEESFVIQESALDHILYENGAVMLGGNEELNEYGDEDMVNEEDLMYEEEDLMDEGEDLEEDLMDEGEDLEEDLYEQEDRLMEQATALQNYQHNYAQLYESLNTYKSEYANLHAAYKQMNEQNNKFKNLLKRTQTKLNEVNLQNAKLHYTNRILNSVSLNERQKYKIVEAVEKAGTVEETKTIYETLQSAVGAGASPRKPQSLNEMVNRQGSSAFLPRKRNGSAPETQMVNRMQKLAGIK